MVEPGNNDNKTTLTWTDGTQLISDNTTDVTLMDDIIYTTNVTGSIVK